MKKQVHVNEFILWVYQDQKADIVIDRGVGLYPAEKLAAGLEHISVSGDGCHQVEQTSLLGTRVDYSGRGTAALHPDAELAHDTLRGRSVTHAQRGIILDYGKSGREPDWLAGKKAAMVPVRTKKGRLKFIVDHNRNRKACSVEPTEPNGYLEFKRFCYLQWWDALEAFRVLLVSKDMLSDHDLMANSFCREPWLKEC